MKKLLSLICVFSFAVAMIAFSTLLTPTNASAQYNAAPGFKVAWSLDPRDFPELFPHGPAFGARSVLVGMDFDHDGRREILFTTDETLAPGGPDPGFLDVYLYENNGDDSYTHVWHYTMPEGSNSLPALTYGDIDSDGLYEIYFGVPTINNPNKLFIFEQAEDFTFPDTPTLTWDYGRDASADFRPSGFQLDDVDGDGKIELISQSRTGSNRELVVAALEGDNLDEFATFVIEFEEGNAVLGGGGTYDVEVVDFDGDGKKEIWYNTWDLWTMAIFEADGPDTYSLQVELDQLVPSGDPGSFNSQDMYFQDVDGDGLLEGWFPMTDGKLYYIDDTDDVSSLTAESVIMVGTFDPTGRSRGASVGDIDDDGRPDIVAGWGTSEKVSRIEYQEIGSPVDSSSYTWDIILDSSGDANGDRYYPPRIAPVDLDGDGMKEVVLTNLYASEAGQPIILVLEYDASTAPKFAADYEMNNVIAHKDVDALFTEDYSGNSRTVIGGFDLDQDGAQEIILTDYARAGVQVMEYNAANDVFELVWTSPADTVTNRRLGSNPRTDTKCYQKADPPSLKTIRQAAA